MIRTNPESRLNLRSGRTGRRDHRFLEVRGKTLLLHNNSFTDEDDGEYPIPHIMIFKVAGRVRLPIRARSQVDEAAPAPEVSRGSRESADRLGDETSPTGRHAPVERSGTGRIPCPRSSSRSSTRFRDLEIINTLPDCHPFHLHQVQLPDRRPPAIRCLALLDRARSLLGVQPEAPPPEEAGWKDVLSPPGFITRVMMRFDQTGLLRLSPCHILEHEDMDMMRPIQVLKSAF